MLIIFSRPINIRFHFQIFCTYEDTKTLKQQVLVFMLEMTHGRRPQNSDLMVISETCLFDVTQLWCNSRSWGQKQGGFYEGHKVQDPITPSDDCQLRSQSTAGLGIQVNSIFLRGNVYMHNLLMSEKGEKMTHTFDLSESKSSTPGENALFFNKKKMS